MASEEQIDILRQGARVWNDWRKSHPSTEIDLSDLDFENSVHPPKDTYDLPHYEGFDFCEANLNRISARNIGITGCRFNGSDIYFSDLCFGYFSDCNFDNASMRVSRIGSASFQQCSFRNADLSYCSAEETDFSGSDFTGAKLEMMSLVAANFTGAKIVDVSVYGTSAWDLRLDRSKQANIRISNRFDNLTIDSIEVAQFINLLIHNPNVRTVIETITTKVVLILGRFTEERMEVLQQIKARLSTAGYVPILFDFAKPSTRDLTETISALAHLSRFVVADITSALDVRRELQIIVPNLPSVPIQPLIERKNEGFATFEHCRSYPWVLPVLEYDVENVEPCIVDVISACEKHILS